jgi:hypothetical protein
MRLRIGYMAAVVTLLAGGWARADDAALLSYKFVAGQTFSYSIDTKLDVTVNLSNVGEMAPIPLTATGTIKQTTSQVLPSGDAEVITTFDSLKMAMNGNDQDIPSENLPSVTTIISSSGAVKSIKGLENTKASFISLPLSALFNACRFCELPNGPVKVGDTWSREMAFPTGNGRLRFDNKMLTLLDEDTVRFSQAITGSAGFSTSTALIGNGSSGKRMTVEGPIKSAGTVSFSTAQGRVISTEGTADLDLVMNIPNLASTDPNTAKVHMTYKISQITDKPLAVGSGGSTSGH